MMQPYPAYKNAGVPWLGEIPEHWEVVKTKYLFKERVEKGYPNEPLLAATQTEGVILKEMYETRTVTAQKDLHLLKLVERGDFVISLRSFQGGIEYAFYRGIISPAYTVMKPLKQILPDYFKHLAKSKTFIALLQTCVVGIREGKNIDYDMLKRANLPLPPFAEQKQIAAFLDWKSAQIQRLIDNKQQQMAKLKAYKQSMIHRAVTRGLNPAVKFKPSGVPWLGDIPEHWEVRKITHMFRLIGSGTTPQSSNASYYSGNIPWVMSGDLNDDWLQNTAKKVTGKAIRAYSTLKIYPAGSLIIAMYGATIGKTALTKIKACTNQACCVLANAQNDINTRFMQYLFFKIKPDLVRMGYGGGQPNISQETIKSLRLPLPPFAEQKQIVEYLEQRAATIDRAINRAEQEIQLLAEYRTRLIADVVTGKLDVRAVALPPNETAH